jgi:hypothetical protein
MLSLTKDVNKSEFRKGKIMAPSFAVCGIDCAICDAYLATQANDENAKASVAARWQEEYHITGITNAFVTCDGCLSTTGRLGGHCPECELRTCALEKGLASCAYCEDYDSCVKLANFLQFAPMLRDNLEQLRISR